MASLSTKEKVDILSVHGELYMDVDGDMIYQTPGSWGKEFHTEFNKPHSFYVGKIWRLMRHRIFMEIRNIERRKAVD